jgi:hypothetical protein
VACRTGPAPTQFQSWSFPKQTTKEWTEWFKALDGDNHVLRSKDYGAAIKSVDVWMKSPAGNPEAKIDEVSASM